ncbi:hypothetical protein CCACVL1_08520 [Corchorus capsularis]|uniref:Uncharacterized protein n=1 Tax=Corchorus capsularis TaxID=210143 RepID=A0A1R3J056_COCAP|nr:hypothetical protein CCACVL1_08520 [Corchorus capsularis]
MAQLDNGQWNPPDNSYKNAFVYDEMRHKNARVPWQREVMA